MAFMELIISEDEWQNLIKTKDYANELFDVNIVRKDERDKAAPIEHDLDLSANDQSAVQLMSVHCNNNVLLKSLQDTENCGKTPLPPPVIAILETKSSHENLEKCKKFACAFTPSDPDYQILTLHFGDKHSLEMVQDSITGLQRSTAALIDLHPEELFMTISGHHACVNSAQQKINTLLKDSVTQFPSEIIPSIDGVPNQNNQLPSTTAGTTSSLTENKIEHVIRKDGIDRDSDELDTTSRFSSVNNPESDTLSKWNRISNHTESSTYRVPSEGIYDESSEDENIFSDERFSSHIDLGLKCGYSESQILNVLKRLGEDCSVNAMMGALVYEPQENDETEISNDPSSNTTNLLSKEDYDGEEDDDYESFDASDVSNLRPIIIDGSNVAMSHGQKFFSCLGIKIVVDWFKNRGHKDIIVVIPQWRKEASRPDAPIKNQEILSELENERIIAYTPSRRIGGARIVCYDDRYILQVAVNNGGIVVSNDVYRDLVREKDEFREVVEKRLLMYTFVKDMFMPPEDPLGRQGPILDNFLRIKQAVPKNRPSNCPYGKKCTYGIKCKYFHPERRFLPQKMVAEKLKENAELRLKSDTAAKGAVDKGKGQKQKLFRTVSLLTQELSEKLVSSGGKADIQRPKKPPPLQHSKSLVYPSSYLAEMSQKMEKAEWEDDMMQMGSLIRRDNGASNTEQSFDSSLMGASKHEMTGSAVTATSQPSSTVDKEPSKLNVKTVKSFPSFPAPDFRLSLSKPEDSSVSVSVSKSPSMLGGHVHVAKRLSDEENTGRNFFSQHISRVPGMPISSVKVSEPNPMLAQNPLLSQVPFQHYSDFQSRQPQDKDVYESQEIFLPPELPPHTRNYTNQAPRIAQPFSPAAEPGLSQENRVLAPHQTTFNMVSKDYDSFPPFLPKNGPYEMSQHQHFKRSMSSYTPSQSSDFEPPKLTDRKYSLNSQGRGAVRKSGNPMSPQFDICVPPPTFFPYNPNPSNSPSAGHPPVQRHRASVDNNSSGGSVTNGSYMQWPPILFSPTGEIESPFHQNSAPSSPAFFPMSQTPSPSPMICQQQGMAYHLPSFPSFPSGVQPSSSSAHTTSAQAPLEAFAGCLTSNPWQQQQQHHQQPLMHNRPTYEACFENQSAANMQGSRQFIQQPSGPLPETMSYSIQAAYPAMFPTQYYQTSPPPHEANALSEFVNGPNAPLEKIDDEAPICPNDPRYSLYYNLSSVFGEKAVRIYLNRNPSISEVNVKDLYSKISKHKQKMGL